MRRRVRSLTWAIPAVLMAHTTLAAEFRESFDETRPPAEMLQGQLVVGEADGWTGEVKKGTYFLIDRETPGAVKTIVLPQPVAGEAKITVTVFGQFEGEKAGAGIVYGHKPGEGYYAFVVTANSGYALYRGGPEGLRQISKGTNNAIQVSSINRLAAELKGSEAVLSINGQRVYGHTAEAGTSLQGQVGIVAIDKGAYSFDDFALTQAGK